jgi:hypothetical protein
MLPSDTYAALRAVAEHGSALPVMRDAGLPAGDPVMRDAGLPARHPVMRDAGLPARDSVMGGRGIAGTVSGHVA